MVEFCSIIFFSSSKSFIRIKLNFFNEKHRIPPTASLASIIHSFLIEQFRPCSPPPWAIIYTQQKLLFQMIKAKQKAFCLLSKGRCTLPCTMSKQYCWGRSTLIRSPNWSWDWVTLEGECEWFSPTTLRVIVWLRWGTVFTWNWQYAQFLGVKLINVISDIAKNGLVSLPGTHTDQSLREVHPENSSIRKW